MSFDSACKLHVRGSKQLKLLLVITRALTKSVVVMANKRVLVSVRESGDQPSDPTAKTVSKQATIEVYRFLNL